MGMLNSVRVGNYMRQRGVQKGPGYTPDKLTPKQRKRVRKVGNKMSKVRA